MSGKENTMRADDWERPKRRPDDSGIGDLVGLPKSLEGDQSAGESEVFLQEAERLLGMEVPELRRLAAEALREGAEVLRHHHGWSEEELAKHLDLPCDFTSSGYVEVKAIHLGQRITELREIAGFTPVELADTADVSINVIRVLEEGHQDANPYVEELKRIASALDTNLTFLEYWAQRLHG
jgi:ribosome-binding protein aMBF1 (putative translation factor)